MFDTSMTGHTNTRRGGGILCDIGVVDLRSSTFSGNSAPIGGAIYNDKCTISDIGSVFTSNSGAEGAAIYALQVVPTLSGTVFRANVAERGAGLYSGNAVPLLDGPFADSVLFDSNVVLSAGGGVFFDTDFPIADPYCTNCTHLGNQASGYGKNQASLPARIFVDSLPTDVTAADVFSAVIQVRDYYNTSIRRGINETRGIFAFAATSRDLAELVGTVRRA